MPIVGSADDPVTGDSGSHHHHAADRPVILAVAIVVPRRSAKVGAHHDRDLVGDAQSLCFLHREVCPIDEVDEPRKMVAVMVAVRVEAASTYTDAHGEPSLVGGKRDLDLPVKPVVRELLRQRIRHPLEIVLAEPSQHELVLPVPDTW